MTDHDSKRPLVSEPQQASAASEGEAARPALQPLNPGEFSRRPADETPDASRAPGARRAAHARKGGRAVVEKYGREYMRQLGLRGAKAVVDRYGLRFYSEIAARNKGVKKRKAGNS